VQSIGQGWSPRCERESVDSDADWAVIKTTAIQPLAFDGSHNKKLPSALTPREHLELEVGDLLITRAGPRSRVGITCLIRQVKKRLILCDKAYRIRCDESRIDKEFLELVLNAPHMVNEIDELKTGINDSGLNLTQGRFFTLMIPVPALGQQRRLVEQIHTKVQCIEDQELAIELSLKQSAAQRKNILKAAFTGQLVPQDPNDEPASVLLERIRAERDNVKCPSTRSRRTKPPKRPVEPHV
jgi:type I restriction enzyme S subunit